MFMQIDCVNAAQEPQINEKFINKVVKAHYPGIQMLLQNLEDPLAEIKRAKLVRAGNKNIDILLDEEKQKMNASELVKYMEDDKNRKKQEIRKQLIEELTDYFENQDLGTIIEAVDAELRRKGSVETGLPSIRKML